MIRNTYLDIAENDLEYLESVLKTGSSFYNQLAVQAQMCIRDRGFWAQEFSFFRGVGPGSPGTG